MQFWSSDKIKGKKKNRQIVGRQIYGNEEDKV